MAVNLEHAIALSADDQLIAETNAGVKQIEQETVALAEVAKDLGQISKEQGDDLHVGETRLAAADSNIDEGNEVLKDIPCCTCCTCWTFCCDCLCP